MLAVAFFSRLNCLQLWIAFGVGKHFRYIAAHQLANALGPDKSVALPFFHALSGCDTVSAFAGRGKKTAWETWNLLPDASTTFCSLSCQPSSITDNHLVMCERFVVLLYDKTSSDSSVNVARKQLFCKKGRPIDNIPPTQNALLQHLKRAAYQAGYVWAQSIIANQKLPSPSDWGWQLVKNEWHPVWITTAQASDSCAELVSCGCKTGCTTRRCKCVRADLSCTALCACDGECNRD